MRTETSQILQIINSMSCGLGNEMLVLFNNENFSLPCLLCDSELSEFNNTVLIISSPKFLLAGNKLAISALKVF